VELQLHTFLTSTSDRGEWSGSHPGTNWIGGWVDPRDGLDAG